VPTLTPDALDFALSAWRTGSARPLVGPERAFHRLLGCLAAATSEPACDGRAYELFDSTQRALARTDRPTFAPDVCAALILHEQCGRALEVQQVAARSDELVPTAVLEVHLAFTMPPVSRRVRVPLDLPLPDLAATEALGRALARLLRPGDVVALHGDLGAGKTALARALIRALPGAPGACGDAAAEEVPSPTFTLVQTYDREPAPVWHFDLYRLEDAAEVDELGFSEALAGGISLIEWPERLGGRLGGRLPAAALNVILVFDGDEARRARLDGGGDWPDRLAELRP